MTAPLALANRTILTVALSLALAAPALAERVGVSSAVNPGALSTPPGGTTRTLLVGQDIFFNQQLKTDSSGQVQVLFVDRSSLSVGPDSDLVIDEFVYDPAAGKGKITASIGKGLVRFVGGAVSKNDDAVTLKTPVATIGIRGGVALINVGNDGTTSTTFLYGTQVVVTTANGEIVRLTRPGFGTSVFPGGRYTDPALVSFNTIGNALKALQGAKGSPTPDIDNRAGGVGASNGNLSPVPNDLGAINLTPSQTLVAQSTQQQSGATQPPTPPSPPVTFVGRYKSTAGNGTANGFLDQTSTNASVPYTNGQLSFSDNSGTITATINGSPFAIPVQDGIFSVGPGATTQSPFGPVTGTGYLSPDHTFFYADLTETDQPSEADFIFGGVAANASAFASANTNAPTIRTFNLLSDQVLGSQIPFLHPAAGGNIAGASISPLYMVTPANTPFAGSGDALTTTLQASLAISGQGAAQQSAIVVSTGQTIIDQSDGQPAQMGNFVGTTQLSSGSLPITSSGTFATVNGGNNTRYYGGSNLSFFAIDQNAYVNGTLTQSQATASAAGTTSGVETEDAIGSGVQNGGVTNYGFTMPAVATSTPASVTSTTRTTQTLSGYATGIDQAFIADAAGNQETVPIALVGTATVNTNAQNNRVAATLGFSGNVQGPVGSGGNDTLSFGFGSTTGAGNGNSAFINDAIFGAVQSSSNAVTYSAGQESPYTIAYGSAQNYLVSAGTVSIASLLPEGASLCDCQYVQWGFWGTDATGTVTGTANDPTTIQNNVSLGTWVAGPLTDPSQMQTLAGQGATAAFTGAAIGTVDNNGAIYTAAGGFSFVYNFGTGVGHAAITNFDGLTLGGSTSALGATVGNPLGTNYGRDYIGSLVGPNGLTGTLAGSFFGPNAVETGGRFGITGNTGTYTAIGVFTAKR